MERQRDTTTKILVSNTDMKIGSNKDINKDHKRLPVVPPDDTPKTVIPTTQHDIKMLNERHNDGNIAITLLIVGSGLIVYHFW